MGCKGLRANAGSSYFGRTRTTVLSVGQKLGGPIAYYYVCLVYLFFSREGPSRVLIIDLWNISEPEAAAVHCAHLTNLHRLKPSQNFMICDAGGGTVVSRYSKTMANTTVC